MILWWLVLWLFFVLSFSEVHVEAGCGFLMAVTVVTSSSGILFLSVAPFTLTFEWGDPASIFRFLVCVKVSDDRSSTGTQYWGSGPVWMVKAVVQSGVVSVWWCGNYICPSLNKIKRKVPQSNVTGPNISNVVTGSVFFNLYKEKNTAVILWKVSVILSECIPRNSIPQCVRESDSVLFSDGDYVIM